MVTPSPAGQPGQITHTWTRMLTRMSHKSVNIIGFKAHDLWDLQTFFLNSEDYFQSHSKSVINMYICEDVFKNLALMSTEYPNLYTRTRGVVQQRWKKTSQKHDGEKQQEADLLKASRWLEESGSGNSQSPPWAGPLLGGRGLSEDCWDNSTVLIFGLEAVYLQRVYSKASESGKLSVCVCVSL